MAADQVGTHRTGPASKASLALALFGFAVSLYLTIEHYSSSATLACPESATINCAKVTTSHWSNIAGVPVAMLGLGYFTAMAGLLLPAAWRHRTLDPVRVGAGGVGTAMIVYLVWIELFRVNAIWSQALTDDRSSIAAVAAAAARWRRSAAAPAARPPAPRGRTSGDSV